MTDGKTQVFGQLEDFYSRMISAIGKTTDDELAQLLKKEKATVAVAESLTGGEVCERLSAPAGASEYFIGGLVCYTNRIKVMELSVPASLIAKESPVSQEVAKIMAENIRKKFKTSIGLAVTGVAGPLTVSPPKPVGLVYAAISTESVLECKELNLAGTRQEIRKKAAQACLGLLWLHLTGQDV